MQCGITASLVTTVTDVDTSIFELNANLQTGNSAPQTIKGKADIFSSPRPVGSRNEINVLNFGWGGEGIWSLAPQAGSSTR